MIVKENFKESANTGKKKKLAVKNEKTFSISPNALEIKHMFPWSSYDDLQTNNKKSTMPQRQKNVKTPKINLMEAAFFVRKKKFIDGE